jgi:hypothetical protein
MRRRPLLVILLALAAVLGAACGGDGGPAPIATILAASSHTIDADSSRVALSVDVTGAVPKPGGPQRVTGEGLFDYAARKGTMTMQTDGLGLPGISGAIQLVMLGDVFYMQVPSGLLPGKPWLKIDLATLGQASGLDLAGLQELGSNDPSANLRFLAGAQDVVERGEAKVRGVDTTQYHFVVDLEKAKAKAPDDLRDDIDRLIAQIGGSTYPADAWVDGDNLVRRLRVKLDAIGGEDSGSSAVVTQDFFDFGVQVDAVAPPADQVSDFAQLLQGAGLGRS